MPIAVTRADLKPIVEEQGFHLLGKDIAQSHAARRSPCCHHYVYQASTPWDYGDTPLTSASLESDPRDSDPRSSLPRSADPSGRFRSSDRGGFSKVGEETDRKIRAEMLDEGLAIVTGLWSGQPFSYIGQHYQVQEMTFLPPPLQSPRIPIWVIGAWPRLKSMRRTFHWDGILPTKMQENGSFVEMTPADIQAMKTFIEKYRSQATPFDIIMEGETSGDDPVAATAILLPLAQAGVTWWLEVVWVSPETKGGVRGMFERIQQGPPSINTSDVPK